MNMILLLAAAAPKLPQGLRTPHIICCSCTRYTRTHVCHKLHAVYMYERARIILTCCGSVHMVHTRHRYNTTSKDRRPYVYAPPCSKGNNQPKITTTACYIPRGDTHTARHGVVTCFVCGGGGCGYLALPLLLCQVCCSCNNGSRQDLVKTRTEYRVKRRKITTEVEGGMISFGKRLHCVRTGCPR